VYKTEDRESFFFPASSDVLIVVVVIRSVRSGDLLSHSTSP